MPLNSTIIRTYLKFKWVLLNPRDFTNSRQFNAILLLLKKNIYNFLVWLGDGGQIIYCHLIFSTIFITYISMRMLSVETNKELYWCLLIVVELK